MVAQVGNRLPGALVRQSGSCVSGWRGSVFVCTGFLVPIKDPEAVAERLITLIEDPKLREEMGKYGRSKFLKNFTINNSHRELRDAFYEIMED